MQNKNPYELLTMPVGVTLLGAGFTAFILYWVIVGDLGPFERGVGWFFAVICFLATLLGITKIIVALLDIRVGGVRKIGRISDKRVVTDSFPEGNGCYHRIWIESTTFDLKEQIYTRVNVGDSVAVTYWPRTGEAIRIELLNPSGIDRADGQENRGKVEHWSSAGARARH